ncbi:MAG: 1-acyl-sn-glycerol-3-phosphate acyltransferase [Candidatus Abyssobacteria bacterium SURF_5]|uniref:1-acyl-sn-glycerol-3-phosphate acyltransferase n=1 Tax=Abyssobacteria bacterium (strain SURF_5) TaxID=2093360 RepID=A0A3A4PAU5_ABYX5|nr:MAG: 1-acyl-sn-glycerol-3-phosphate acyltransferase [Candidatus Abyssubacteria bacterium SURF_5]
MEEEGGLLSHSAGAAADVDRGMRTGIAQAAMYVFLIGLYTTILGIPCLLFALINPKGNASYWFIATWARLLLWTCGVKVDTRGGENIPPGGSFIIMSTHNSHFDIPVLIKEVRQQFRIVAKKSLFKIPIFGWIMSAAGYVSIDRGDRAQAFSSLDRAAEMVRAGMPLLIFPEGTRSPDGSLGSYKKGGFVLAVKAGVSVIPVVIEGTYHVLPKTTWRIRPGRVRVIFGEPIDASQYTYESRNELMERVRRAMLEMKEAKGNPPLKEA